MADLIGKTLGKYQLTERIGHGGMAEVYKAHHTKLDRDVTIKVLHSHLIEGEDFLERFEREARALAGLRHAHIVGIHDFEVEDGLYYMVMEYIDGGSLGEKLGALSKSSAYLPVQQAASILKQVGEALDYAHQGGIIHRDIKPSNILLDSQGNAYLTDFGIARMMSSTQFTATGALIGTPTYMSPEQGQGLELDPTSDIYSLGVVLFEMLTGKAPFFSDTPLAVIHKHIHEPLPRASELRSGFPAMVEKVLFTALAKDRQERYGTALEFSRALEAALTPEVRAALDAVNLPEERSVASLPTMRVEDPQKTTKRSDLPTEAMSAQTIADLTGEPESTPEPEPVSSDEGKPSQPVPTPSTQEQPSQVTETVEAAPITPETQPASSAWLARLKSRPVALAVIAALVVIALVLAFGDFSWGVAGGEACANLGECMAVFEERMGAGDPYGALESIERAIDTVPAEDHAPNAWLWCDRAAILEELGEFDEANFSRDMCGAWERGE